MIEAKRGLRNPHQEKHFTATETVRDVVIGMSDGLTVPFALAAGLTGAVSASHIIIAAGMAEIATGSIAMGLGGYLAARGDAEHYVSERIREEGEVRTVPDVEAKEIENILQTYGLKPEESAPVIRALQQNPKHWIDFMMRFELGLEEPDPKRAPISALTIAGSYIVGGSIPLSPIFYPPRANGAPVVCGLHHNRARRVWICERQSRGRQGRSQRHADRLDWQHCRSSGIAARQSLLVICRLYLIPLLLA